MGADGAADRISAHAAAILQEAGRAGQLRFDLDPEAFLISGSNQEVELSCDNP